jgi:hypothetical protein
LKDVFGVHVKPGDQVAHATKRSTSIGWKRKDVLEVHPTHLVVREGGKRTEIAKNFVVLGVYEPTT